MKCERCEKLNYSCFGGLETAISSSPRRALSRKKCQDCREAKQKVFVDPLSKSNNADLAVLACGSSLAQYLRTVFISWASLL